MKSETFPILALIPVNCLQSIQQPILEPQQTLSFLLFKDLSSTKNAFPDRNRNRTATNLANIAKIWNTFTHLPALSEQDFLAAH